MTKNVLILSYSDLSKDVRVLRQVQELGSSYRISTGATVASGLETGTFIRMLPEEAFHLGYPVLLRKAFSAWIRGRTAFFLKSGSYESLYWSPHRRRSLKALEKVPTDLIIANDIDTLPLAIHLARKHARRPRVIFDAHEFSPGQNDGDAQWRKFVKPVNTYLCKTYMPQADRSFTVSQSIADAYEELTSVTPLVLTNAPPYVDQPPVASTRDVIDLVHHGGASPERQTLELVQMMDLLGPGYRLNLFLFSGDKAYLQKVRNASIERRNVVFHAAMPTNEILSVIREFDIGIHMLPPTSFNHIHAMPNKLFEFIQARLAVAVSPSPDMARLVSENGLGAVAAGYSFKALADAIRSLDKKRIAACKRAAHTCASSLSAEENMILLRKTVAELIT
ncbi:MAG: hypothetical protein WBB32_04650 [Flavobacteriales bacterium]